MDYPYYYPFRQMYPNPDGTVPGAPGYTAMQAAQQAAPVTAEESYIENILRMNRGKIGTFYMTYENNREWNAKVFRGVVETAGRDHIIISEPETGKRFILLMVNLDYITFDEPVNYIPPTLPSGIR